MTTRQEWVAGTNPTNGTSVLRMLVPTLSANSPFVTLHWQSVSSRIYYIERATGLGGQTGFTLLRSNIYGSAETTSFTDTTTTNGGSYYYRVGVQGVQ